MRSLTYQQPNSSSQVQLHSVERAMPVIRRLFGHTPNLTDVVEAAGECLDEIGNTYGGEYLTLQAVEPSGIVYLPTHCRRVLTVQHATGAYSGYGSWTPASRWPGRQWVADQVGDVDCWRLPGLGGYAEFRNQLGSYLGFARVADGIYLEQYRRANNETTPWVVVGYEAQLTDERGWPLLTDKDANAVAAYWNWQRVRRDTYAGVANAIQLLPMAWDDAERAVGQARVGEGLSEQDLQLLTRVAASWDRGTYASGFAMPHTGIGGRGYTADSW